MNFDIKTFNENYLSLETKEEIFLIEFLFELTIAYRALNAESAENNIPYGLKQINELNHRLLNRLRDLQNGETWSTKEDTLEMIEHHIRLAPFISGWVSVAVKKALTRTLNKG